MRSSLLILLALLLSSVQAQQVTQTARGDCNVALGVNRGVVEITCGLHAAALRPLVDRLMILQRDQSLRGQRLQDIVDAVNLLMEVVISQQNQTVAAIREQTERVLERLPARGDEAIDRFQQEARTWRNLYQDVTTHPFNPSSLDNIAF